MNMSSPVPGDGLVAVPEIPSPSLAPTISIDIDETLCCTYPTLYRLLALHDHSVLREKTPNDYILDLAERREPMWSRALRLASREAYFYRGLPACSGSEDTARLRRACEENELVAYAIAARPALADDAGDCRYHDPRLATQDWLLAHGFNRFIGTLVHLSGRRRLQRLRDWGVCGHLTAVPSEVELLRRNGIRAYLMDHAWNRGVETLWRVSSVADFVDIVLTEAHNERSEEMVGDLAS